MKAHSHTAKSHDGHSHGASHVLANQLRQVKKMAAFANASDKVNDADRDAITGALQADADALTAVQSALADAPTHRDVVGAIHQGILVRAIARTQLTVALVANTVRDAGATAADSTVADAATSAADDAVATVVALTPDATRADLNEARHTAMAELRGAEQTTEDDSADEAPGDDTSTDGSGTNQSGTADPGSTSPTP